MIRMHGQATNSSCFTFLSTPNATSDLLPITVGPHTMSRTRAHPALRLILIGLLLSMLLPLAQALECKPSVSDDTGGTLHYDLTGLLDHEVTTSKTSETPPTKNIAKLRMMVCGDQGLKKDPDLSDEDQVSVCVFACMIDQGMNALILRTWFLSFAVVH